MWRPRAWLRQPGPRAAPGLRPGTLRSPARSLADDRSTARRQDKSAARRRDETAATARREAPRASQEVRALKDSLRRLARRPPRVSGGGTDPKSGRRRGAATI